MDILIKNMEMPKSCEECWMTYEGESDNCPVVNESVVEYMIEEKRHPKCPLIPVPEHGDLVDRDAVATAMRDYLINHFGERLDEDLSNAIYALIAEAEVVLEKT